MVGAAAITVVVRVSTMAVAGRSVAATTVAKVSIQVATSGTRAMVPRASITTMTKISSTATTMARATMAVVYGTNDRHCLGRAQPNIWASPDQRILAMSSADLPHRIFN